MQIKYRFPMASYSRSTSLPIHDKSNSSSSSVQHQGVPILLSPFVLALFLSLSFLFFISFQIPHHQRNSQPIASTSSNFSPIFHHLQSLHLLSNSSSSNALILSLISSNQNQDIQVSLTKAGFPGLITETHQLSSPLPFADSSFDLVFSNAFEEASDGAKLAQEVERMLKDGGVCMLLVGTSQLQKVIALFQLSDVVEVRQVDGFASLHTQLVLKKHKTQNRMKK